MYNTNDIDLISVKELLFGSVILQPAILILQYEVDEEPLGSQNSDLSW